MHTNATTTFNTPLLAVSILDSSSSAAINLNPYIIIIMIAAKNAVVLNIANA